jgi:hypothetical protein
MVSLLVVDGLFQQCCASLLVRELMSRARNLKLWAVRVNKEIEVLTIHGIQQLLPGDWLVRSDGDDFVRYSDAEFRARFHEPTRSKRTSLRIPYSRLTTS